MKQLKPIIARQKYDDIIEARIMKILDESLFAPLFKILKDMPKGALKNDKGPDELKEAVASGKIFYEDGRFYGTFSAKTTKYLKEIGAKWVPSKKAYSLKIEKVPVDIKIEISKNKIKAKDVADKALKHLEEAQYDFVVQDFSKETDSIVSDLNGQLKKTTPESHEIPMAIKGYIDKKIKETYSGNLNLYIKDWHEEQIKRLRKQIIDNSVQGFRASKMVDAIESEYGVSRSKAKFLARQETGLMVSAYKKANYEEMGIKRYKWSTSHDSRVRPTHKAMNNKICRWDNPLVYWDGREWSQRSNIGGVGLHPGEDFLCRCVGAPLLEDESLNVK